LQLSKFESNLFLEEANLGERDDMIVMLAAAITLCLFLAVSFILVFRKLAKGQFPAEEGWYEHVVGERYRPMGRLLQAPDFRRLQDHPAITRKMLRGFRANRVRAFRGYLECLSMDYSRVSQTVKLLMVQSAKDRPDLATLLVRHRMVFTLHLMIVEGRLALYTMGVGTVEASHLVTALASMRLQLNSLLAVAQPVGA
jgi:hypothetical protein